MGLILKDFWHNDKGATAIEYALIAGIVSIGIVGAAQGITTALVDMFGDVEEGLNR